MSWSLYRWTWQLESPLYVGMPPAGSLNRCRLYVPARAVWGAVTAEVARATAKSGFPKYQEVGKRIRDGVRFTYLFPAQQERNRWLAWLPRYKSAAGLLWEREDSSPPSIPERQFRMRLLSTRPSTAIEPSTDTAAEGSLRETECLNPLWRPHDGLPAGPVALVGYVFLRTDLENELRQALVGLEALTLGGDNRYGLGCVRRVTFGEAGDVFGCKVNLASDQPGVDTERVLAHGELNAQAGTKLRGDMELLRGWDYGQSDHWPTAKPLWVPGSVADGQERWQIDSTGHWTRAA
ncbi:MAG: hypothetical protein KatS3mg077_0006 [Candidatus Binatia bacterium]|nr:MAG: hypothetical protein KatS3mg077_0006 [Candidatus Binatia bacterium]